MLAQKSLAYSIVTDSIENGLDRKCLVDVQKRFLHLNQQRLERTHSALNHHQQHFLNLLPLLFHVNHPMLPGYIGHNAPAGICEYTPLNEDIQRGKNTARSFRYNKTIQHGNNAQAPVEALFLMGSLGTVAHSRHSDLDIWVCHQSQLSQDSIQLLEQKCQKITAAAKVRSLDCHFFLMDAKNFEQGLSKDLSAEASGSAQHFLLLDEFYRTAIWLAGRLPLWWFVPATREQNYQDYRHKLLSKRYLAEKKVLDFGSVATIPAGEFAGAALWQLYKAIEAPFKSVFKLILLESYTSANTGFQALALDFKQQLYNGNLDVDEMDPYIVAYRRIEQHLQKRDQLERLELVRRCLYFKVNKPLSRAPQRGKKSWQRLLLEKLVSEWQWSDEKVAELDRRRHWKADKVIAERTALVNELIISYRNLKAFKKQHQANTNIDPNEFSVLGHKLFANYERRPGKIDWINPGISDDLSEDYLCFVEDDELQDNLNEGGTKKSKSTVWRTYSVSKQELQSNSNWQTACPLPLKRGSLMETILWCHCNGLLTESSRCDFVHAGEDGGPTTTSSHFRPLIRAIQQWLPLPLRTVSHDCFKDPAQTTQLFIHINLGREPYQSQQEKGLYQISDIDDALGYGELKDNLVKSIDLVSRNSWNEIDCYRFENAADRLTDNALVACLRRCLQSYCQPNQKQGLGKSRALPDVRVYCSSTAYGNTIRHRVGRLLQDIFKCFNSIDEGVSKRYIFSMENGFFSCQQQQTKSAQEPILIEALANREELESYLSRSQSIPSPIIFDRYVSIDDGLRLIAKVSTDRAVNVVYKVSGQIAELTVLDEQGSLYRGQVTYYDNDALLRSLHYFLRSSIKRQSQLGGNFKAEFDVFPIRFYHLQNERDGRAYLEPCHVSNELSQSRCLQIQASVNSHGLGDDYLTIVCNGRVFSQQESGTGFMSQVLEHIANLRRAQQHKSECYPCYITDLDLSAYQLPGLSAKQWQISHYLRFKVDLESRMNAEL